LCRDRSITLTRGSKKQDLSTVMVGQAFFLLLLCY